MTADIPPYATVDNGEVSDALRRENRWLRSAVYDLLDQLTRLDVNTTEHPVRVVADSLGGRPDDE